ncbi:MAG: polysaccharide deacetylase family protein [Roseiflexaceae bacterium]
MRSRVGLFIAVLGLLLLAGALRFATQRSQNCQPLPLLGSWLTPELLPNANFVGGDAATLPNGWQAEAPGALLRGPAIDQQGFDYNGDGRALQLIGIANALTTQFDRVQPGQSYCFRIAALTDSTAGSATRLQLQFIWHDAQDRLLRTDTSPWQAVVLWQADAPASDWSLIQAAFRAPQDAAKLTIRIAPASDDRIYLDRPHLQQGGSPEESPPLAPPAPVTTAPWPQGAQGALSFSFDWETAMGGLIHSRSVDDPYGDQDPEARAMRMREGVTTTLKLFRPYRIRATYFANGYNFLLGNTERRQFLGNPTYTWPRTEQPYAWRTDEWITKPWFGRDPYGSVATHPAWYFGDLIPILQAEQQAIESHTFAHLYAGFASPAELAADAAEWNRIAAEANVAPATALAFPWSGSAGLSDRGWQVLEQAGITTVTRTNRSQRQYQLVRAEDVRCLTVPGHEAILACADFYLTARSAPQAIGLIDQAIAEGGMIDLWAHTEEVISLDQIAAWGQVVRYAGEQQQAGRLWIAPISEITAWQRSRAALQITQQADPTADLAISVAGATTQMNGLAIQAPFVITRAEVNGQPAEVKQNQVLIDLPAGASVQIRLWQE